MMRNTGNDSDPQGQTADKLGDVVLGHFTATPPSIGPFGSCQLNWAVTAPPGVRIMLDNNEVAKNGSQTVRPPVDVAYRLSARAGQGRRSLSTLPVHVDTSTCALVASAFDDPKARLLKLVTDLVLGGDSSLSIATQRVGTGVLAHDEPRLPEISFTLSRMTIVLHLKKNHVPNAPDPLVDVTIATGLHIDADTGELLLVDASVSGEINEPWWVDLVPIYGLIVSLKAGEAMTRIPMQFAPLIAALPQLIGVIYPIDASKQRYQTADMRGGDADPPIRLVACRKPRNLHIDPGRIHVGDMVRV